MKEGTASYKHDQVQAAVLED